jgi:hypothetical protein
MEPASKKVELAPLGATCNPGKTFCSSGASFHVWRRNYKRVAPDGARNSLTSPNFDDFSFLDYERCALR